MNKKEFLNKLKENLVGVSNAEIDEILTDFEEHFIIGAEQGKSEKEISESLGDPRVIAMQFSNKMDNVSKKSPGSKIAAGIGLFFLNFYLMIWLFLSAYCVLFGLWASAAGLVLGGVGSSIISVLYPLTKTFSTFGMHPLVTFLYGLICAVIGLLLANFCFFVTKWFVGITKKYINWNINIFK